MALYAIGDTHLSFGTNKPMDMFSGWENYTQRLKEQWLSCVTNQDTVVIAGDISWGMTLQQAAPDFAFLHDLPGQKLLMKGNHDYWWTTKQKMEDFFHVKGFDSLHILYNNAYKIDDKVVCGSRGWFFDDESEHSEKILAREAGRLRLSIEAGLKLEGTPIVFLHYPPITQSDSCKEMMAVLKEYQIQKCYYGHLHAQSTQYAVNSKVEGIDFQLISADYLKFKPLLID